MALGVVVDFVADITNGAPPFTVQFTDLSIVTDGFARQWFWDFGDGTGSEDQNPSHEYDGTGGETFNVKLVVLITSGEFDVLATANVNAISAGGGSLEQNGFSLIDEPTAWEDFLADSPVGAASLSSRHTLSRTGGTDRQYKNITGDLSVTSVLSQVEGIINTLTCSPGNMTIFQGVANANGQAVGYSNNDIRQFHSLITSLVQSVPFDFSGSITPVAPLPDVESTNITHGLQVFWTLKTYLVSSSQLSGTELKNQYIQIGTPPVAAFDADPTVGPNPLPVQFENLTVESTPGPTSYVWKKRISGSGDSFATFSTAENPLEIFTK
jgi:PKD repeat protein